MAIVRQFASKTGICLHEINLERHLHLNDIFKTLDIDGIIKELDAIIGANVQKPGSLLFLDEIQFVRNLPSVVKYLIDHYKVKFFLTGSASFYLKNLFYY